MPTPAGSVTRLSRQALTEPISTTRDGTATGHPDEKTVYCESFGQKPTGGEILNYAAWEPATGHKGGCGAYYVERNYYNTSDGVPYGAIRRAIQIMNPARKSQ